MRDRKLDISLEHFIPISVDQVWNFFIDQHQMKKCFRADKFVIDIWEGGEIEISLSIGDYERHAIGENDLVLPKNQFAFVRRERDDLGDEWFSTTTVPLYLEEKEYGTHVKLVHHGFKYLPPEIQQDTHHRYSVYGNENGILERLGQ
jgi:hypothetical protein